MKGDRQQRKLDMETTWRPEGQKNSWIWKLDMEARGAEEQPSVRCHGSQGDKVCQEDRCT